MACFVLIVLFLRNQREQAGCLLVFVGLKDSPDTNSTGGIWSVTLPCLGKKNGSFSGVCGTSLGQYIRLNSSNPCTSVWKAGRPSSQPHRPWVVLARPLSYLSTLLLSVLLLKLPWALSCSFLRLQGELRCPRLESAPPRVAGQETPPHPTVAGFLNPSTLLMSQLHNIQPEG